MRKYSILIFIVFTVTVCSGQDRYDAILKAQSLSAAGKKGEALSLLTSEISRGATAGLYQARAGIYLADSKVQDAVNDFMASENLEPGTGLFGLARCAAIKGDAKAAAAYLEAHLKSERKKDEPSILIDETFGKIAATPEWKALWKKEWYKGYERGRWEVENSLKAGRIDLAKDAYESLESHYPEMPVTEYCRAIILFAEKRYGESAVILRTLTDRMKETPAFVIALARAEEKEGNYYASANAYSMLIRSEYPDAGIYISRAEMLMKAGDNRAGKDDLEKYLSYYPDDFKALALLSQALSADGAVFEAMPYLNRNVENNPGKPESFALRGDAWYSVRSWDKAAEDYTMSLDLDPDNAAVNLNLGISLVNTGRTDDACHYLKRAKDLGDKRAGQYLAKYCIR